MSLPASIRSSIRSWWQALWHRSQTDRDVEANLALRKLLEHWMPANNHSPWIFAPVTGLLLAGSAFACLVPAVRAARADPMETLRSE